MIVKGAFLMQKNRIICKDIEEILHEDLPWEQLRGATVAVSGASGILPSYMVETLLALNAHGYGIRVVGLVRNIEKARKRFACWSEEEGLTLVHHDVCEPLELDAPVDFVIHAAGQASPKFYGVDPVGTAEGHAIGTREMLRFAAGKHVRGFLYFSSCAVYGYVAGDTIDESYVGRVDSMNLRSCYPEGKRMGETLCMAYRHQYGVPVKILRIAHTYGPLMPLDDGRSFADFVGNVLRGEDIALNSDGSAIRPMLYLSDAIRAYFRVMLCGTVGEAYNIVSDEETTILHLAQMLVSLVPEKRLRVTHKPMAEGYLQSGEQHLKISTEKIKALGWKQHYTIREGFRRTIESYQA